MHRFSIVLLAFFIAILALACGRGAENTADQSYADFAQFYERFHRDSAFQMERIVFPLQGLPRRADSLILGGETYYWRRENWKMQRDFNFEGSDYNRTLKPVGNQIMVEEITRQSGQFGMMRRWAKIDGEWHLIYYAALNKLKKG